MTVSSPRQGEPFVHPSRRLTNENFELIQAVVNSLNGLKDANGFLYTIILGVRITVGTGSPENVVTGSPPDIYLNLSGGATATMFLKESGAATNTGWAGV